MKISENAQNRRYCGRLYHKARARGFDSKEFNEKLLETFGVGTVNKLEYEDYKKTIAMLNALPLLKGHEAQPKKKSKVRK